MLFALIATASFFGLADDANAQALNPFVCSTSFTPLVVRSEGQRELVGDIVITCSGGNSVGVPGSPATLAYQSDNGNPPAATIANGVVVSPGIGGIATGQLIANSTVPAVNISVTLTNGIIANRILEGSLTDALLFIDDPSNSATYQPNRGNQNPCVTFSPSGFVSTPGVCTGLSYFFENGVATGAGIPGTSSALGAGTPINVIQGQIGSIGGAGNNLNTITFVAVPVVQPGTHQGAGVRTYRIKNIRVKASAFTPGGQILGLVTIQNPPSNLVLNNATGLVGFVQQGLKFSAISGGPYAQCLGFNNSVSSGGALTATGALRFEEFYGVSFKRRGFGGPLDVNDPVYNPNVDTRGQSRPGATYNTESGFYNTGFPTANGLNLAGRASNGTRLRARFSGVPTGVSVFVSLAPVTDVTFGSTTIGQGANAPGSAWAVAGTDQFGATQLTFSPVTTSSSSFTALGYSAGPPVSGAQVQGWNAPGFGGTGVAYTGNVSTSFTPRPFYGQVTIGSDGVGTYVWEVLRADDNSVDKLDFLVAIRFAPTTSIVTNISAVESYVSGNYAPIRPDGNYNDATIPSFVESPIDRKLIFTIGNCATNLLYPFVSSVTGFNTGIAVSNTSSDPFGTTNEAGVFVVNFYGEAAGGVVLNGSAQTSSKALPSGRVATFNLLFGNSEWGITPVTGFQGYIIIQCNFRWAHGFAFISDPSNLQTAHGYLALVLDPNGLGSGQLRRNTLVPVAEQLDN